MPGLPRLAIWEKLVIFFTSPFFVAHIIWATKNFEKGGKALRDEHYRWVQWGIFFYLLVLLAAMYLYRSWQ